jgi:hypothetical protein
MQWGMGKDLWPKYFPSCPVARHFVCFKEVHLVGHSQNLASMHLENTRAGSFCAWRETFTLLYSSFSFPDIPISTPGVRLALPFQPLTAVPRFKSLYKRPARVLIAGQYQNPVHWPKRIFFPI